MLLVWPLWTVGALAFVCTTVGFALLGAWYDHWKGTAPKGLLVGILSGWAVGIYELYKVFQFLSKKERRRASDSKGCRKGE